MDAERFDTLVRSLTSVLSRRGLLRAGVMSLAGTAMIARGLGTAPEVEAKKKKKKKKKNKCPGGVVCPGRFCCDAGETCCSLSLGGGCCPSTARTCCVSPTGAFGCCA